MKSNDPEEDLKSDEKRRSSIKKNSNIFAGVKTEKVCLICERPGDTVRCRGPCCGTYHVSCLQETKVEKVTADVVQKHRRGRKSRKTKGNLVSSEESVSVVTTLATDSPVTDKTNAVDDKSDVVDKNNTAADEKNSKTAENNPATYEKDPITVENNTPESNNLKMGENNSITNENNNITDKNNRNESVIPGNGLTPNKNDDPNVSKQETNSVVNNTVEVVLQETDQNHISVNKVAKNAKILKSEETTGSAFSNDKKMTQEDVTLSNEVTSDATVADQKKATADDRTVIPEGNGLPAENINIKTELVELDEATLCKGAEPKKKDLVMKIELEDVKVTTTTNAEEDAENKEAVGCASVAVDAFASSRNSAKYDNANGVEYRCNNCINNILYPCFTCGKEVEEKTGEVERYSCYLGT